MKRPLTTFHAHTLRESQVIRSKKSQNLSVGQNFLAAQFFLFIDILLKLQQQPEQEIVICFCKFSQ